MRALFTPPVFADEEKTYAARLLYAILLITLASTLLYAVSLSLFLPQNALAQLPNTLVISALCATMFFLIRRGFTRLASLLLIGLIWFQSLGQAFLTGGIASPNYTSHIAIILGAGLLMGARAGIVTMGLSLVAGYGLVVAEQGRWLPPTLVQHSAMELWLSYIAIFAVVVILQSLATRSIGEALARARASEARYRTLVENLPDVVARYDRQLRHLYVSPGLHDRALEDFLDPARRAPGQFPTALIEKWERTIDQVFTHGHNQELEFVLGQEAARQHYEARVIPERSEAGEVTSVLIISRDVTHRRRVEERDQTITRGLRAIIKTADELIRLQDLDLVCRRAVELAREQLGLERCGLFLLDDSGQELLGTYGTDVQGRTTDERRGREPVHLHPTLFNTGDQLWDVFSREYAYWDAGQHKLVGRQGWVVGTALRSVTGPIGVLYNDAALSGAPLDEAQQESVAVYCSLLGNIIERKRAEAAVRESETLYRRAIEAAGAVPYYLDYSTETYRFMGDGILALTGYAPEEMTLARWRTLIQSYQLLGNAARYSVSEAIRRMRAGDLSTWESDELIRARDGQQRWVLDTSVQVLDDQGAPRGSIGILQDITGRKRAEDMRRVLYEVAEAVHTSPDLPALFRAIHRSLGQLMDVSNFFVALCVPGRPNVFTFPYAISERDSFEPIEDLSDSLTAYVTRTGKAALVDLATREALLRAGEVKIVGALAQLWLGVPLKWQEEVIGVISVQSYTDPHRYNERHVELLSFVSNQIALATERKRAEERERNITQGLRAVVEAADELIRLPDLDTFYRRAVELAREKLKIERCSIFLFDATQERQRGTYGTNEQGQTVDERFLDLRSHGAALELMAPNASRRWMIIEGRQVAYDTSTSQRRNLDWGWIGCTLIRSVAQPIGVFYNDTAITHTLVNETQQEIIAIYCSLLGNILERKWAEAALAEQATELRMLYQTSVQLAKAGSDMDALTQRITDLAVHDLKFAHCGLWLIQPPAALLHRWAVSGETPDATLFDLPLDGPGLVPAAVQAVEPVYVADVRNEPHYVAGGLTTLSEFAAPLRVRDQVIGVLNLQDPRLDAFSERDRRVLTLFAERATLALDNAQLVMSLEQAVTEVQRLNAELEERVAQRTAQLEATLQELEAFSYSISHDLRAPLRAMDGFSRLMLEDYADHLPSQAAYYLGQIRKGAQQMGQLIDDLLTFSRLGRQALRFQPLTSADLAALVTGVVDELRAGASTRPVEVVVADLPACQADPALLKQVFVNLLSNAFKFSQRREVARVEVGSLTDEAGPIYFVRDQGVGFDMRYVHKLFGVFQRLHSEAEFEGTGVGLAIVQRIIHKHGGQVWAEGVPNQGATFYFTLPAPPASAG